MLKALKYRIYPNVEQKILFEKHFGCVRLIYNLALETKSNAYLQHGLNISRYDLQKQLKEMKQEFSFLKEVNSQSLQYALLKLDTAYQNFFREFKNGKIEAKKNSYIKSRLSKSLPIKENKLFNLGKPKYKSKNDEQKFHCPQFFEVIENKLYIPKLKSGIKIVLHRALIGEQKNVTISKTPTGKYFASILVEDGKEYPELKPIKKSTALGGDLGIKTFAVFSDSSEIQSPQYLRQVLERIKILQKRLSKCKKGGQNYKKLSKKIAKLHEKAANQRKDFLHKGSDLITKNYDTLCFEDLAVKNMVKNPNLSLSISDAGWGMFTEFVKYKCKFRGKNYIEIGRFEPSSQTHNKCGFINKNLKLSDRTWVCECGEVVQRDFNSTEFIRDKALENSGSERPEEPVELPTMVGTEKQEATMPLS